MAGLAKDEVEVVPEQGRGMLDGGENGVELAEQGMKQRIDGKRRAGVGTVKTPGCFAQRRGRGPQFAQLEKTGFVAVAAAAGVLAQQQASEGGKFAQNEKFQALVRMPTAGDDVHSVPEQTLRAAEEPQIVLHGDDGIGVALDFDRCDRRFRRRGEARFGSVALLGALMHEQPVETAYAEQRFRIASENGVCIEEGEEKHAARGKVLKFQRAA